MTHGSLFSGIGGFDLAAEWMGWENMFHCEWNEFGQKVLKYYWPDAELFTDITKSDFTKYANRIDILTGGFPCQPYSLAGKRKGKEDERHLWPEMLRAIREIQPRWVVGENVFGLINWSGGLVFHEVQADLEAAGYEVWPYVLPACAVNAPHRRDRVWFVAHSKSNTWGNGIGNEGRKSQEVQEKRFNELIPTPNPNNDGCKRSDSEHEINTGKGGEYALDDIKQVGTANAGGQGLEGGQGEGDGKNRQGNWEAIKEVGFTGSFKRPSGRDWEKFPTQSPICSRNDGVSGGLYASAVFNQSCKPKGAITFSKWRNESIKAAGNAIVPQVAYQIFKAIEQYENTTHNV